MDKLHTIKSHREFDRLIQTGAHLRTEHFRLHYLPNQVGFTRIGIAVGKRNGGAVTRVRLKRQVRAMVAKRDDSLPLDLIIVIRPETLAEEYAKNEIELLAALDQIRNQDIEK
ncbi:MAG: ribonuclease P protein component [Bacilli bacterium]|nr:ribonuclease P protein component [Bacilli bacterium]